MHPSRQAVTPARAGLALVALAILWRVIHVNAVVYGEDGRPRIESRATAALAAAPDDSSAVRAALRANPAQVAALLVLAGDHEREGRREDAGTAYDAAYRLAPLDRQVLHAGSAFYLREGRVDEALPLMDRLVEHYPEDRATAFPVMAEILASRRHAAAWDRVIARDPEWAGAFVVASCASGLEPSLLMPLFLSRVAAGRARPEEGACLVDRLRRANRWDDAYQLWLNTLPRERLADVGSIFNGGFEFEPSGVGFDWIVARQPEKETGHAVEIARTLGSPGKHALKVRYNGKRQAGAPILQYLALAPGRYEVSGLARPDAMRVGRGVQWALHCAGEGVAGATLARSERFTGSSEWRRFAFGVDVPASCPGQLLVLEPAGPEESAAYIAGVAWFDELAARRLP
ncbi:MAG: hypothetical protein ACXWG3_16850 [Usitatibacter sp.]